MDTTPLIYDELVSRMQAGGTTAMLECLASRLQSAGRYHEWFEVLKIQLRHRLELPSHVEVGSGEVDEQKRRAWETGLLDACRKVGRCLLDAGRVREGWMYLRPVGDLDWARQLLQQVSPSDENRDELIEIYLQEGVDPVRGLQMVLQYHGTCNAMTAFDTRVPMHQPHVRRDAAEMLVRHLYRELVENVRADIARREGQTLESDQNRLRDLLASRPELCAGGNYHVDVSHLAVAVRAGRFAESREVQELAADLAAYGTRLDATLQYPGQGPFVDHYRSHQIYLDGLLAGEAEAAVAIDYFRKQADETDIYHEGSFAVEIYIELLVRLGRIDDAMQVLTDRLPPGTRTLGIAPSLLELCRLKGDFATHQEICRSGDDWVGFAVGLLEQTGASSKGTG